jgi:hypothetical protein
MQPTTKLDRAEVTRLARRIGERQQSSAARMAEELQARRGVQVLRAQVVAVQGGRVDIRRPWSSVADGKLYPVIAASFKPQVGQWIWGLEVEGGLAVLGRALGPDDEDVADASRKAGAANQNASARLHKNGAEPMYGDLSISKTTAKLRLGHGFGGPHGLDFGNEDGSGGLNLFYRSGSNTIQIERPDGTVVASFPANGDVIAPNFGSSVVGVGIIGLHNRTAVSGLLGRGPSPGVGGYVNVYPDRLIPAWDSGWRSIAASNGTDPTVLTVTHGLGERPDNYTFLVSANSDGGNYEGPIQRSDNGRIYGPVSLNRGDFKVVNYRTLVYYWRLLLFYP